MPIKHRPEFYNSKIKTLDSDFVINLTEMATDYPYAKTHPNILTYSTRMDRDKSSMNKTRGDIFILRDNIKSDIEIVDKTIKHTIKQISKLENDNVELLSTIQELEDDREGAIGMYDDSKERYNFKLLENWLLFASICGIGFTIYNVSVK
jgi:hypothetical protein